MTGGILTSIASCHESIFHQIIKASLKHYLPFSVTYIHHKKIDASSSLELLTNQSVLAAMVSFLPISFLYVHKDVECEG